MRYRIDYQETHDIDWFFRYKGNLYHAASNGGLLPSVIDSERNRTIQERLENVIGQYKVELAKNVNDIYEHDADLTSFIEYASKGFISLDRTEKDEAQDTERVIIEYHVVAFPSNGNGLSDEDLLELIPELQEEEIIIKGDVV